MAVDAQPLYVLTATEALARLRVGTLTVEAYATALLDRIAARDAHVRAWAYLDPAAVLQQARALDKVPMDQRGPLHGLPIGVKDVIYTRDMPTQHNSSIYKGSFPQIDASSIAILRHAGALIFGKTHTTEFAATTVGTVTRNPHVDPASGAGPRTPGGSSSGSGAAVGDAHVPIALTTQTGGSTVRPAAYNGVYGLKPTWGAVSREGQKFYSLLLDTLGWYARSAADLRLIADILGVGDGSDDDEDESDQRPPFAGLRGARIAVCRTVVWPRAAPATRAALARAADILRAHGAIVEDLELPAAFDPISEWHRVLLQTDGRATFLAEHRTARPELHKSLAIYIDKPEFTRRQGLQAQDGIAALRPRFDELASRYDAVLTPSVTDEAPLGLEFTGSADFCNTWSALHVPVVNIPGFKGPNGLPVGVSLVAPRFRDRHLLEVAEEVGKIFEAEGGWTRRLL